MIHFVGAGPGAVDLITVRGQKLLETADQIIYAGSLVNPQLLACAKAHNVNYLIEASVGGGIPIIRPMAQCLAANHIEGIAGILNGTTNFILTQMIEEDMLEPLNFDHIPNFQDIDPSLLNPEYDPENLYSVPYMFGILGIIYNPTMVDEGEDMETWDVLWNEKYAGDILMFDNSRDTIGISLKRLGYSYNTTDSAQIEEAVDQLIAQKPLLQAYVMDDIFEKLEGENAAIGVYYYGDYLTMKENNDVLAFALPREGTNRYVDAMCIPKGAENKENAEKFINFMCSTAAGLKNCEETWYSTPLLSVREELGAEVVEDSFAYPDTAFMSEQCETFSCLPAEIRTLYNDQWVRLMNAS